MQKLTMHTANIADQNFQKLAALFPQAVTESVVDGKVVRVIDKDVLMQEIGMHVVDGNQQRYQFTWPDKAKTVHAANQPLNKTLRPCREESVNFDITENLYIEGDNLEVLKLLQETYLNKVKMIYIDPPYNTGKDFVYSDNFTMDRDEYDDINGNYDDEGNRLFKNTESNGRFHTDWLNMMYPRLKVARDLLSDDGVIFISIDDNEVHNLRKIADEIFGADNAKGTISRVTGTPSGQGYNILVNEIDYILVYSKSEIAELNGLPLSKDDEKIYDQEDSYGCYLTRPLRKTGGEDRRSDRPTMYYEVKAPDNSVVYPISPMGYESRWRCSEATYHELVKENRIEWKKDHSEWKPYQKFYLEGRLKQPSNFWYGLEGNKKASLTIKKLFKAKVFETPKPLEVISRCLKISCDSTAIILDFFSGSATTAHAVMQLNAEDGGKRKFIMVQLPEETAEKSEARKAGYANICEIGKERIRRAGMKIKETIEDGNKPFTIGESLLGGAHKLGGDNKKVPDIGFRVLKVDESNMTKVYYNPKEYNQEMLSLLDTNIKADRTPEDLLFQVMLELGIPLSSRIEENILHGKKVFQVYHTDALYLVASFDENLTEAIITEIAQKTPFYFVMRDSSQASDSVATNFEEIFKLNSPTTQTRVL